eukprot:gb/GEZN01008320.1/.p1 GENE.gb/GEZN01008320.1/~~gb/GEZN01008320.1/.p1  ORF type:complete len:335 (-),score=30.01 gb/GEZN01008320.1/:408-1412(-)
MSLAHTKPENIYKDFTWVETDEPHATRRKLILAKYPEIKTLFTKEPRTVWFTMAIFIAQMLMADYVKDKSWGVFLLAAYAFGGTLNHSLQLAVHELSHKLAFENDLANRLACLFANLVTGVPSSMTFTRYHMEHHQFQGVDGVDTDVPTTWEVNTFTNMPLKVLWLLMQPFFYAFRPLMVKPKTPQKWELINHVTQWTFDVLVFIYMGPWALGYMIIGSLLGMGLHPCAGHFVAEHYEFTKGFETYSYYGPCNWLNFNVGYHYEHHDFPKIPWSNLPKVRGMAPEFYNDLPHYSSYLAVFWKYITDPEVGPHSRVKRKTTEALEMVKRAKAKSK